MTIHKQVILGLKKYENLLPKNITSQRFAIMSKIIWRDAMYTWPQKQSGTNIMTYNPYQSYPLLEEFINRFCH